MAKSIRYTKKLRQKLEKISTAREHREDPDNLSQEALNKLVFQTLWHEFMPTKSIAVMHSVMDEQHMRLETRYTMHLKPPTKRLAARPPWLDDNESPASS